MSCWISCSSKLRDCAFERYRIAMSLALAVAGDVFAHALDHVARFVLLVVRRVQLDRRAGRAGGPQLLAEPVRIVRDDRVRGGEDVAGRAVVLFEADRLRARKIAQEKMHVLDARAAPAVDRLIVVADDEHLPGRAGEHADPRVLQRVGVLEFVDQQMPEALAVVLQQRVVVQPELVRAQQQLGEIDEARRAGTPLRTRDRCRSASR